MFFFADKEEDMLKYINIGVDAILTNYPDKLIKLIKTVVERLT